VEEVGAGKAAANGESTQVHALHAPEANLIFLNADERSCGSITIGSAVFGSVSPDHSVRALLLVSNHPHVDDPRRDNESPEKGRTDK